MSSMSLMSLMSLMSIWWLKIINSCYRWTIGELQMFKWFLPRTYSFFEYFEQHSEIIVDASSQLLKIIIENQDSNLYAMQITQLEKKADEITHQCIEALHKTFITPFE